MPSSKNILFCILENEGGMADVARSYLETFLNRQQDSKFNHVLILLKEEKKPNSKCLEVIAQNIYRFYFDSVFYLKQSRFTDLNQSLDVLLLYHRIDLVLCDYIGFTFFKYRDYPIIADVHYLMASSNKVRREIPDSKFEDKIQFFKNKVKDILFRRSLLLKQKLEKNLLLKSELIIANSKATRKDIIREYPSIRRKKIVISRVSMCLNKSASFFQKPSKNTLVYHGRLNSIKGVQFLPQISQATKTSINVFGANKYTKNVFDGIPNHRLVLVPWTSDQELLYRKLAQYRFHIFPSFYEPWGLALTKSLGMGAICIANSRGQGHCEQISHRKNGYLIDFTIPGFEKEILAIMNTNPKELSQIALNANNTYLKFSAGSQTFVGHNIRFCLSYNYASIKK